MKASEASCSASRASAVQRYGSTETVFPISLTSLAKGSLRSSRSVVFWYFRISISALVPGLYLLLFAPEDPLALVPGAELGPPCAFEKTRKRSKESCRVRSGRPESSVRDNKRRSQPSPLHFSSASRVFRDSRITCSMFLFVLAMAPSPARHSRSFGLSSETVIRATGSRLVWRKNALKCTQLTCAARSFEVAEATPKNLNGALTLPPDETSRRSVATAASNPFTAGW